MAKITFSSAVEPPKQQEVILPVVEDKSAATDFSPVVTASTPAEEELVSEKANVPELRPHAPPPPSNLTYPADVQDFDGPLASNKSGTWETIPFESPFELMYFFTPHLQEGRSTFHPWQIEVTEALAKAKPTALKPYRLALCAANGSGKDSYVVAPFVIWFALTKIRSLTIVTSSSGGQLTAQTENLIASLARTINTFFGEPIFKITKRFIKCLKSGSEIRLFATDEEGKAEGYHPFPDEPDAEMAIIVNEAKSVEPKIFRALSRCTGYNYWLNVSTPAEPIGDFHYSFNNWPNSRRVTAFDCPHISPEHIENLRKQYGEHSTIYRSQVLAEFASVGGETVIDQDHLNKCIELSKKGLIKPTKFGKVKVGLDVAAGRDENAGEAIHGNTRAKNLYFVEKDTTITEERISRWLDGLYLLYGKHNVEIYADDGGVGHGILDHLRKRGHDITRVLNNQRAFDHKQFGNRGTEMWYNMRRVIEECILHLPLNTNSDDTEDMKLYKQLAYRHFKRNETSGKIVLMSKSDEKGEGGNSPDRADALALALSSTDYSIIERELRNSDKPIREGKTIEQLMSADYERARVVLKQFEGKRSPIQGNSLEELLSRQ